MRRWSAGFWVGLFVITVFSSACGHPGGRSSPVQAPANVVAVAGACEITVTWEPVRGATSYNLYWSAESPVTRTRGILVPGATSPFVHRGIRGTLTYHYVVTAIRPPRESSESNEAHAEMPARPGILDTGFGNGGVTPGLLGEAGPDGAIDASGRILLAGESTQARDPSVCRHLEDGRLPSDPTWRARRRSTMSPGAGP